MDHPRRCQARTKKPCRMYACRDSRFCPRHGGKKNSYRDGVRVAHLAKFYSRHLTGTLKDYVESVLGESPESQLNLFEELAIFRHTTCEAIKLYDLAQASDKPETRMAAAVMVREQLAEVGELAERAARVEAAMRDKVSVHNLQYLVNQLTRIMHDVCEKHDRRDIAEEFERLVSDRVKVAGTVQGTTLTPSQDVREMDDLIPRGD